MASSSTAGSGKCVRRSESPPPPAPPQRHPPRLPPAGDRARFIDRQAKLQFHSKIRNHPILYEHLVDLSLPSVQPIEATIHQNGWEFILEESVEPNLSIVREFYANFSGVSFTEVVVRGCPIPVTLEAIQAAIGIHQTPKDALPDDHQMLLEQIPSLDWDMIKDAITERGSVWTLNQQMQPHTLASSWLHFSARVWMHILFSHIMPCSHVSQLPLEKVLYIYCLATEQHLYLPRVIRLVMETVHHDKKINGLPFPFLITWMAMAAGVPTYADDQFPPADRRRKTISGPSLQRVDATNRNCRSTGPGPSISRAGPDLDCLTRTISDQIRRSERRVRAHIRASEHRVMRRLSRLKLRVQGINPDYDSEAEEPADNFSDDSRADDPDVVFSEEEVVDSDEEED